MDAPGLLLTGLLVQLDGKLHVAQLDMQDPRHDLSKLYAVLDSAIRDFRLGAFFAAHDDWLKTAAPTAQYRSERPLGFETNLDSWF